MVEYPIPMKDDPIGFMFKYHQLLSASRESRIMVFVSFFIIFVFTFISSYYLWMEDSMVFLKHYSTVYFLSPWIFATMFTEIVLIRSTLKLIDRSKFWDMKTVSQSMRLRIQKMICTKRIEFTVYLSLCLLTGVFFPLIGQLCGRTVYHDIHYLVNYTSGSQFMKFFFITFAYLFHQLVTFYAISSYMILKYLVQSIIFQLYILADFLNRTHEYKKNDNQSLIKNHLGLCASQHIFILRLIKVIRSVCYTPIIYLLVCGQLVLLGCSIFLFYNHEPLEVLQIGSIMILSYILAMDFCQSGQDCNDALDEFRMSLFKINWYEWNEVNKKIILIILTRTQRDETIKTLGLSVDRTLMVMILKFAYQAMLLFLNMNSRSQEEAAGGGN